MKKLILCLVMIAAIAVPSAFSQLRFEIGANVPVKAFLLSGAALDLEHLLQPRQHPLDQRGFLPRRPQQQPPPPGRPRPAQDRGVGVKVQSIMLMAYAAYPNAQVELALGPLCVDASLGGYYIGLLCDRSGIRREPARRPDPGSLRLARPWQKEGLQDRRGRDRAHADQLRPERGAHDRLWRHEGRAGINAAESPCRGDRPPISPTAFPAFPLNRPPVRDILTPS